MTMAKISPLTQCTLTVKAGTATVSKDFTVPESEEPVSTHVHTHGLHNVKVVPYTPDASVLMGSSTTEDTRQVDMLSQHVGSHGNVKIGGDTYKALSLHGSSLVVQKESSGKCYTFNIGSSSVELLAPVFPQKPTQTYSFTPAAKETTVRMQADVPGIDARVSHQFIVDTAEGKDLHTEQLSYVHISNTASRNIKGAALEIQLNQAGQQAKSFEFARSRSLAVDTEETGGGLIVQRIPGVFSIPQKTTQDFLYASSKVVLKQAITLSVRAESGVQKRMLPEMHCMIENSAERMAGGLFEVFEDGRVIASLNTSQYLEKGDTRTLPGVGSFDAVPFSSDSEKSSEVPDISTDWQENLDGTTTRQVGYMGSTVLAGQNVGLKDRTVTVRYDLSMYDAGVKEVHVQYEHTDGTVEEIPYTVDTDTKEVVFDVLAKSETSTPKIRIAHVGMKTAYKA